VDEHPLQLDEPPPALDPAADTNSTAPAPARAAAGAGSVPAGVTGKGRGRRQIAVLRIRSELSMPWRIGLAAGGLAGVFALWVAASARSGGAVVVPSPADTWKAIGSAWSSGQLSHDFSASMGRIGLGYAISMAVGLVAGLLMGSFTSVESAVEAPIAFLRYIPATALTPLLLLWLGIGESPKVTLIVLGTVFFNTLMVADVVRTVPQELIKVSYTLGAGRMSVLRKVILPHSVPGVIDVARINLAAGWLMLVVAELLAARQGLAYRIVQAQRFHQVDVMFAMLIVFGVIGVASDLALRWLRNAIAPWARP
jgi:NitT/TauT family transport system permease protein